MLQVLSDASLSIFQAGLCPAAKLYFASDASGPFLRPEIAGLKSAPPAPKSQETPIGSHADRGQANPSGQAGEAAKADGEKRAPKWLKLSKK